MKDKTYKLTEAQKSRIRTEKASRGECECLRCSERATYEGYCVKCFAGFGSQCE